MDVPSPGVRAARVLLLVIALFFTGAAAFALLIAVILIKPGTALDGVWAAKPASRSDFVSLGILGPVLMILLAAVLVVAAVGLYRRFPWARWLAFALLVVNVVPDAVQGVAGQYAIFIPISIVTAVAVWLALPVVGRACRPRVATRQN